MNGLTARIRATGAAWNRFWFEPLDLLPLAAFRVIFGSGAFVFYAIRQWDFQFLFSERGIAPSDLIRRAVPIIAKPPVSLDGFTGGALGGLALHTLFISLLLGLALGLFGRPVAWLCFLLHIVFFHRNPLVFYGADQVATPWLLYLCLARCDACLAVPVPWRRPVSRPALVPVMGDPMSTVAARLLQVHLCVIYAYSGLHKLIGVSWWRGDALWNALAGSAMDLSVVRYFPSVLAASSFLVVLWEIYFPAMVWIRGTRHYALATGLLLHGFIGVLLNLPFFSWFMVATYVVFVDPVRLRLWIARLASALGWPGRGGNVKEVRLAGV